MIDRPTPVPYDDFLAALRRRIDGITTDDDARNEIELTRYMDNYIQGQLLIRSLIKGAVAATEERSELVESFERDAKGAASLIRSYLDHPLSEYDSAVKALIEESYEFPIVAESLEQLVGVCVNVGFITTDELFRWWSSQRNVRQHAARKAIEPYLDDANLTDLWNRSDDKWRAIVEPAMIRLRERRGIGVGRLTR